MKNLYEKFIVELLTEREREREEIKNEINITVNNTNSDSNCTKLEQLEKELLYFAEHKGERYLHHYLTWKGWTELKQKYTFDEFINLVKITEKYHNVFDKKLFGKKKFNYAKTWKEYECIQNNINKL